MYITLSIYILQVESYLTLKEGAGVWLLKKKKTIDSTKVESLHINKQVIPLSLSREGLQIIYIYIWID